MTQRGFIALPLVAYVAIGAAVLILGLGVALKVQTSRLDAVKAEYAGFVAKTKALGEAQEAKTKETIERQKKEAADAEKRHARSLADLRSKYDRLRNSSSSGGKLPPVPDPAPVADAATRDSRLLDLLQYSEEQTRRLTELQEWVRSQK